MSIQSKVSMVVPVYNKKDDIGAMLESVYNQAWNNIELILVNDGATDGTREILSDWESIFIGRGYSVVIIDQENQGISAAVRNGMLRMTGDYFCSVDCDDYLYPEYVSTMASWLDEHPECDYTACGFERILGTKDKWKVRKADDDKPETLMSPNLAENMLLKRVDINSWIYLIRRSYVNKCKIIENFVTEPQLCQEPSITLPLVMGKGCFKYFPQTLYRHFLFDRDMSLAEENKRFPDFADSFAIVLKKAIMNFPTQDEQWRQKLLRLCDFFKARLIYVRSGNFHDCYEEKAAFAKYIADLINHSFEPAPCISVETILFIGFAPLFIAIEECILEIQGEKIERILDTAKDRRVIYYGALGKAAKKLIPPLMKTGLKPDVLWDAAATPGSKAFGRDVAKPEFTRLNPKDIFVIFPIAGNVTEQVMPCLSEAGVKCVLSHNDILRYLAECYYPGLMDNECKFMVSQK